MNRLGRTVVTGSGVLFALAAIGWAGLRVPPSNFPPPQEGASGTLEELEILADVPEPVARYLETALGKQAFSMESLYVRGRARANFGLWMPLRYRLVHRPGYAFERYMEIGWFGIPVLKAVDRYVDGVGMTGPVGNLAMGPETNQGANMILWAEAPLMPSLFVTDPRIRWQAVDDTSARLIFPFQESEDEMTVHFDPESGLISRMSALRYRDAESGKIPWHVDFLLWQTVNDVQIPRRVAITWEDQGKPWSYWEIEEVAWDVDISQILPTTSADETNQDPM